MLYGVYRRGGTFDTPMHCATKGLYKRNRDKIGIQTCYGQGSCPRGSSPHSGVSVCFVSPWCVYLFAYMLLILWRTLPLANNALHSTSIYMYVYVMFVWSGLMGWFLLFFLKIPVWLVCYAHVFVQLLRLGGLSHFIC